MASILPQEYLNPSGIWSGFRAKTAEREKESHLIFKIFTLVFVIVALRRRGSSVRVRFNSFHNLSMPNTVRRIVFNTGLELVDVYSCP